MTALEFTHKPHFLGLSHIQVAGDVRSSCVYHIALFCSDSSRAFRTSLRGNLRRGTTHMFDHLFNVIWRSAAITPYTAISMILSTYF